MDLVLYLLLPGGDTPKGGRYRIALDLRVSYRLLSLSPSRSVSFFIFFLPVDSFSRAVLICYRREGQARLQKLDPVQDPAYHSLQLDDNW